MRSRAAVLMCLSLTSILLVAPACGSSSSGRSPSGTGGSAGAAGTESGGGGGGRDAAGGEGGSLTPLPVAAPPEAATLSGPAEGDEVFGRILLEGSGEPGAGVAVRVLAGPAAGEGRVEAFIDRAASGESQSPENRVYEAGARDLDLTQSATVDLRFVPAVVLLEPAAGATRAAPGGTFSWEDYRVTAGPGAPTGDIVYALWFATESSDGPLALYVVPETVTSLDLADLSATEEHLDLMPFATCVMSGGQYSLATDATSTCSGGSSAPSASLQAGVSYTWSVAVIECSFPDFSSAASVNDFKACAAQAFGGEDALYAMSEERDLSVQ